MLTGKNVLITGSNRGIGKAFVEAFAKRQCNIWACARKHSEEFETQMAEIASQNGVWIRPVYFELTDSEEMKAAIKQVLKSGENIDVLINNAGIAHGGLFSMTRMQTIREVFDINVFAPMELAQLVLRKMMRQKSGSIINMSSVAALNVRAGNSAYGTSKAAVKAWTAVLGAETAQYGIRVNAIAPSLTDTDMGRTVQENAGENRLLPSAMGRMAKAEEIANVAVFLASDEASFVNGETIVVNGGGDCD
ncbi:SDR family NAD(P)-dependent oxidoreductase [Lachnoclostridium sp. An138]|uniref:SDR family NAD(P)-dependent oxidoreductase n=1 Tax=Lachnoclostridium sp. An138 TaxID=1965560 RepID=UPI000B3AE9CA|nr:SDR family oxidoreductase [Lachnoclostridium sp. An138]OUQ17491.1 hypothetical protein B5E82_10380 [Lachnoclostridium sp. An138]